MSPYSECLSPDHLLPHLGANHLLKSLPITFSKKGLKIHLAAVSTLTTTPLPDGKVGVLRGKKKSCIGVV